MSGRFFFRSIVLAGGLVLATVLLVRSGTVEGKAFAWMSMGAEPGTPSAASLAPETASQPERVRVIAEGRVVAYPGAEVIVGTEAAGRIIVLSVQEKSTVKKGDLLVELNAEDLKANLAMATAKIQEAEADLVYFGRECRREESLIARHAGTTQNLDLDRRGLDSALARRAAAVGEHDRIAALIAKTRILAPIDGVVIARHVHPGETVEIGDPLLTIADLNRIRIEAEVDEFDTARVALNAEVTIKAEGFPNMAWKGVVGEIPDSVVPRRIRPEDPGRPIDARVLPVKVTFAEPTPLKLGQRVEVEISAQTNP